VTFDRLITTDVDGVFIGSDEDSSDKDDMEVVAEPVAKKAPVMKGRGLRRQVMKKGGAAGEGDAKKKDGAAEKKHPNQVVVSMNRITRGKWCFKVTSVAALSSVTR